MTKKNYGNLKRKNEYVVKVKSDEGANSTESTQHTVETEADIDQIFLDIFQTSYDISENFIGKLHPRLRKKITTEETKMDKLFHEVIISKDMKLGNIVALAYAYLNMSKIQGCLMNQMQNFQLLESYIVKSLILVHKNVLHRKIVLIAMEAYHLLSYCRSKLQDEKRFKQSLQKAVYIYSSYTRNKDEFPAPFDPLIYLGFTRDSRIELETLYVKILYTFGEILERTSTQKEIEKCLKYMHIAVQKHFTYIKSIKIDYDIWIPQALFLIKKFAINDRFIEAKDHLVAVCFVFDTIDGINIENKDLPEFITPIQQHNYLFLIIVIARYLILLLNASRNRLLWNNRDKFYKASTSKPESLIKFGKESKKLLMSSGIGGKAYISWARDDYFLNYKEAKTFFIEILKCLNITEKKYIVWNCHVIFKIYYYKYISVAYAVLASYEQKENQMKLYKQRANILSNVLCKACDSNINEETRKLISLQLGYAYATLLENQINDYQLITKINPEESNEFNHLALSILSYYESYLSITDLLKSQEDEYALTIIKRIF